MKYGKGGMVNKLGKTKGFSATVKVKSGKVSTASPAKGMAKK